MPKKNQPPSPDMPNGQMTKAEKEKFEKHNEAIRTELKDFRRNKSRHSVKGPDDPF